MDRVLSRIILVGIVLILAAVPLIYSIETQDSFSLPKRAFFQCAVAALLVLFALRILIAPQRLRERRTPLDVLLLAWLGWLAVVTLCSLHRPESVRQLVYAGCLAGLFFLVTRNVENEWQAWLLVGVVAGIGVLEAAYGIAERMGVRLLYESRVVKSATGMEIAGSRGSILGTFGNANQLATYLVFTVPLLLAGIVRARGAVRGLLAACLAVTLCCLVLTGTRTAWMAVLAATAAFGVFGSRQDWRRGLRYAVLGLVLLALLLAVVFLLRPGAAGEIGERARSAFTLSEGTQGARLLGWRLSLRMISARPILGCGPGNFKLLFFPALADFLTEGPPLQYWWLTQKMEQPHNEYLQIAVEKGLPGLGLFLSIVVCALLAGRRRLTPWSPSPGVLIAALLAAVLGIMTDAFASIPFHVVPTTVAFWAALALLVSGSPHAPAGGAPSGNRTALRFLPAAGLVLFALFAARSAWRDVSFHRLFKEGTNRNKRGEFDEALIPFRRAAEIRPESGRLKFYHGSTLLRLDRAGEAAALLEESKKSFQDVALYKNLGVAYGMMGLPEKAVREFERWREMGVASHEANNGIARVRWRQGRFAEAERLFRETLRVRPWDWTAHSTLGAILMGSGRIEEALEEMKPGALWKEPEAYVLYGAVLMEAGRHGEAEENIRHALRMNPGSVAAHGYLAALSYRLGRRMESIVEWLEVLRLDPENEIARRALHAARMLYGYGYAAAK